MTSIPQLPEVWAVLFLSGQRFPVGVRTRLFSFQVRLAVAALPCCGQPDWEPLLFECHFPIRLPGTLRHGYPFAILIRWGRCYCPKRKWGEAFLQYARHCCIPWSDTEAQRVKELRFLVSYASLPSTTFYPMRTAPTKVRFEAQLFIIPPKRSFSNCANSVCS